MPTNARDALVNAGLMLYYLHDNITALSYFNKALQQRINLAEAIDDKGLVLEPLRNHTGALQYFGKAIGSKF